ncbi:hypothetical protein P7K49_031057 [Saguinus oedipus]|uniref:Uncharacterized protein n=1 Tax=Saguinus oedipus TaxID=9490 RepID=A0ABQ9U3Y0_SAGOE|nr:hypothetical protein P7K49_031057 [Saguinus oedipus]
MGIIVKWKRPFLNNRYSLLDHREVVEVDLSILWVTEETLEVVEVILAVVETLVEEDVMVVEVVAAEVVMEEVFVAIMDLVMVATMAVVLVIGVEGLWWWWTRIMETKVVDMVAVVEDMMVTMKEEILVVVTMVVVGTIMILEIIMDNSNQIMDPGKGAVLVEEAWAVPMVVVMDLVVEVVDMVAEGSKSSRKGLQFLAGERARSCQESCRLL